MAWLWTWKGKSFGYKVRDELRTQDGRHVGRFYNNEVYGVDGKYIGELRGNRLITNKSKKSLRKSPFSPKMKNVGYVDKVNYVGNVMIIGYEEFPAKEDL